MASMTNTAFALAGHSVSTASTETWKEAMADPSIRLALGTGAVLLLAVGAVHACCLLPSVESWHGLTVLCSSAG